MLLDTFSYTQELQSAFYIINECKGFLLVTAFLLVSILLLLLLVTIVALGIVEVY